MFPWSGRTGRCHLRWFESDVPASRHTLAPCREPHHAEPIHQQLAPPPPIGCRLTLRKDPPRPSTIPPGPPTDRQQAGHVPPIGRPGGLPIVYPIDLLYRH